MDDRLRAAVQERAEQVSALATSLAQEVQKLDHRLGAVDLDENDQPIQLGPGDLTELHVIQSRLEAVGASMAHEDFGT